jgi:hypothetical protein
MKYFLKYVGLFILMACLSLIISTIVGEISVNYYNDPELAFLFVMGLWVGSILLTTLIAFSTYLIGNFISANSYNSLRINRL